MPPPNGFHWGGFLRLYKMAAPKNNKFALGNNGGAPTKYDPKYCEEMISYFNTAPNKLLTESGKLVPNELPTLRKFAKKIGVDKKTLLNWAEVNKEFFHALEACKEAYKEFLIENGLLGLYNSAFAVFVAKNTTDMKDKVETEHSGEVKISGVNITFKE